jgi:uncharacterized protein (DUF1778 family)
MSPRKPAAGDRLDVRASPESKARWHAAAARDGLTLSPWVHQALDAAAQGTPDERATSAAVALRQLGAQLGKVADELDPPKRRLGVRRG